MKMENINPPTKFKKKNCNNLWTKIKRKKNSLGRKEGGQGRPMLDETNGLQGNSSPIIPQRLYLHLHTPQPLCSYPKFQSSRYLYSGYITAAEAAMAITAAVATTTAADCSSNRWSMQSLSSALPSLNSITCSSIRFSSSSHCRPSLSLTRTQQAPHLFSSYTGLASNNPLLSLGFSGKPPTFIRFNKF